MFSPQREHSHVIDHIIEKCPELASSMVIRTASNHPTEQRILDAGLTMLLLSQELSGVNEAFRRKIEGCLPEMVERIAVCLELARERGDIPIDSDTRRMASRLVDCWEGAALRSRLRGSAAPLTRCSSSTSSRRSEATTSGAFGSSLRSL